MGSSEECGIMHLCILLSPPNHMSPCNKLKQNMFKSREETQLDVTDLMVFFSTHMQQCTDKHT